MSCDLHALGVDYRNIGLVLDDHIDEAVAVANGLLGRTAQIDRAKDLAIFGVDYRGVHGRVAENIDTLVERISQDAVGPALWIHFNRLDQRLGFDIPHGDRAAAGKPVSGFDVDGRAIRPGIWDLTSGCKAVEIENRHAAGQRVVALYCATGDIQPPSDAVRLDV